MLQQVRKTSLQSLQVLIVQVCLRNAAVVLQSTYSRYDNNCVRLQSCHTALDIQELLSTQVSAEACLCDGVISQVQAHLGSGYRVAAVSDVREGSAVYDSRYMLQSLYQVRLQSVLQKSCHSALCVQIASGNRLLLGNLSVCISDDNSCKSFLQVCDVLSQTQNSHNLGCYGDIVAVLSRHTVGLSAKSVYYVTQLTVIHIYASSPGNLSRVDVQSVALEDVVVNHRCQQVVRCADCVEVAGEVKVDILHRNYLCVSAACCSALYAEYRSQGRLTKGYHNLFANLLHTVCQAYGCGSLSFSCRSRVDSSYQNQLAVFSRFLLQQIVVNFCFVLSVLLQIFVVDTCLCRDVSNRQHLCFLCDFDVSFESHCKTSPFIVTGPSAADVCGFFVDNLTSDSFVSLIYYVSYYSVLFQNQQSYTLLNIDILFTNLLFSAFPLSFALFAETLPVLFHFFSVFLWETAFFIRHIV